MRLENPVIRGFNPDPSICRKGDDYYIITSTFNYFPAIPVYHSKNLSQWDHIGNVISDSEIIDLDNCQSSKGIYASTIRYCEKEDLFYAVSTLVKNSNYYENENFFLTAEKPEGPWGLKTIIKGAEGIDPSLFFDEDGKVYYVGNERPNPDDNSDKRRNIWLAELDTSTGELKNKTILLTHGAVYNAMCPEGPHIYKNGDYYYLLTAEGGTKNNHAVAVFRSRNIYGPYEINPRNPVLTHRHLGNNSEFNSVGHADLFQTKEGQWWAVVLGVRPYGDHISRNIGRETFLVPVVWEDGWPVFAPETGKVEHFYESGIETDNSKDFSYQGYNNLPEEALVLRTPSIPLVEYSNGIYTLTLSEYQISDARPCAFVGIRQKDFHFKANVKMDFNPSEAEEAGLLIYYSQDRFYLLSEKKVDGNSVLEVASPSGVLASEIVPKGPVELALTCDVLDYQFSYKAGEDWKRIGNMLDGKLLSTLEGGFTGCVIALYASSNGRESFNKAKFESFSYSV